MNTIKSPNTDSLNRDTVYHLTSVKMVGRILTAGLLPNSEQGQQILWQKVGQLLDKERPRHLVKRGVSRKGAVFAHPDMDTIRDPFAMGAYRGKAAEGEPTAAISVAVEHPEDVLVADALYVGKVYRTLQQKDYRHAKKFARKYWADAVPLSEFRSHYTSTYEQKGFQLAAEHVRDDEALRGLPPVFSEPEVLIPGEVSPDNLEWVASSAYDKRTL